MQIGQDVQTLESLQQDGVCVSNSHLSQVQEADKNLKIINGGTI